MFVRDFPNTPKYSSGHATLSVRSGSICVIQLEWPSESYEFDGCVIEFNFGFLGWFSNIQNSTVLNLRIFKLKASTDRKKSF